MNKKKIVITDKKIIIVAVAILAVILCVGSIVVITKKVQDNKAKEELQQEELKKQEELAKKEKEKKEAEDALAKEKEAEDETDAIEEVEDSADEVAQEPMVTEQNPAMLGPTTQPSYYGQGTGHVVCIDAGHQRSGDSAVEPNGPGSSSMKARVTGGTRGTTTGVYEYQLNLDIALQLRDELVRRGYTVYMTRESHDVNISNKERAEFATNVGAEISVRIHANGSENTGVNGALALAPSASNPYVAHLAGDSQRLSRCVLDSYCGATGLSNKGVSANDTMTGINWCTVPVTILEMGFMTNPSDDTNMENAQFQQNMVCGIANGIDAYFQ